MTYTQDCQQCGVTFTAVRSPAQIDRTGAPRFCSTRCRALATRDSRHPRYKDVWFVTKQGKRRACVHVAPELQAALGITRPYTYRARVVWLQAHPGERLTRYDEIHHLDGDTLNDVPENLIKVTGARHARLHLAEKLGPVNERRKRERRPDVPCEVCGAPIRPWRRFCSVACTAAAQSGAGNPNAGRRHTDEAKERMRQAKIGQSLPESTRQKMREARLRYLARMASEA